MQWRQTDKNGCLSMNCWILTHNLSADKTILHDAGAIRKPSMALFDIDGHAVVPSDITQYISLHLDVSAHLIVAENNNPFYLKRFYGAPEDATAAKGCIPVTCAGCGSDFRKLEHMSFCYIHHPGENVFQIR